MKRHGIAFVILICIAAVVIEANEAPIKSVGKTIQPRKDVPVRLVSEDVRIVIGSDEADVRCAFYLMNVGLPDTIEVGFPRGWEGDLVEFEAFTDVPLEVKTLTSKPVYKTDTEDLPWWNVFRVPLKGFGEITDVFNTYSTKLRKNGNLGSEDLTFRYIMKTGAYWKDTIEDASITVYLKYAEFDQITYISPKGFERENNRISWHFMDFEPSQNIEISIMQDNQFFTLQTAKDILEKEPGNAHAHFLLGSATFVRSFFDKEYTREDAKRALERAVFLNPDHLDARWYLAALNYYDDNKAETKKQLEAIIERDPSYTCENELFPRGLYADISSERADVWLKAMD